MEKKQLKISILGCGWLGLPLGIDLLKSGYKVKGSTTTKEKIKILNQADIEPYLISVPDSLNQSENSEFWKSDILFLNLPPGRGKDNVEKTYPDLIKKVIEKISNTQINWVIFASSTSIYPENSGIVNEDDVEEGNFSRPSGEAVFNAEKILQAYNSFDHTILRFGGLYGYDRHPVNYLAGRKKLGDPEKPVNLIHQDDCIRIITEVISQEKKNTVYNAVSDGHPPRRTFYQSAAKHFGLEPPEFLDDVPSSNRVVSNKKLKKELEYKFVYPNPMDHTP